MPEDLEDLTPAAATIATVELMLLLGGLVLLWRLLLSPAARAQAPTARLPRWDISAFGFFLFVWCVLSGGFFAQLLTVGALSYLPEIDPDTRMIVAGGAFQFGMLAGLLLFRGFHHGWDTPSADDVPPAPSPHPVVAGAATFVIAMPLLTVTSLVWQGLLKLNGVTIEKQELVDLFAKAESPFLLTLMILLGCVVAPVTEELVFRAGLFRFARGRLPQVGAYAIPAIIFAAVHGNVGSFGPLFMLGLIFSFAYARTGLIAVPIVAHGLFNLNTIAIILAGLSP